MYGADPRLFALGTKTGCRRLFAESGIGHPLGFEDLHRLAGVVEALTRLRAARPGDSQAIVEFNEGVSGAGTPASTSRAARAGSPTEAEAPRRPAMAFEAGHGVRRLRAKAERAAWSRSGSSAASCAARACNCGSRRRQQPGRVLSTHDSSSAGRAARSTSAAIPADPAYAVASRGRSQDRRAAGAQRGDRPLRVDFVVVRDGDSVEPLAIESTWERAARHTRSSRCSSSPMAPKTPNGPCRAPDGREKHLVATDHLESPRLRA